MTNETLRSAKKQQGSHPASGCRASGQQPARFGSVIRGTDTESSDLDLLVNPLPGVTLFDLGAIQIELEESLGISVDVLTAKDLPMKIP